MPSVSGKMFPIAICRKQIGISMTRLFSLRLLTRLALLLPALLSTAGFAQETDPLAMWSSGVTIKPVATHSDRHVIHSYFNTSPESPDGRFVVCYNINETNWTTLMVAEAGEE
jgi:hypothetical protein